MSCPLKSDMTCIAGTLEIQLSHLFAGGTVLLGIGFGRGVGRQVRNSQTLSFPIPIVYLRFLRCTRSEYISMCKSVSLKLTGCNFKSV